MLCHADIADIFKNCLILVAQKAEHRNILIGFEFGQEPIVKVYTGQTSKFMRATIVDRSQRDELWENIIKNFPNYAEYQLKTDRIIPLITLHEDPELNSLEEKIYDLNGRVVVITGASRGIGAETARAFAQEGAKVVVSARSLESLETSLETTGSDTIRCK